MTRLYERKSRAELLEARAAGVHGPPCPCCASRATVLIEERDAAGVLDQAWRCENCDESGTVLNGVLWWCAA